jgi:fermentation-respiration switch protein FrsA (DUF1100 family)
MVSLPTFSRSKILKTAGTIFGLYAALLLLLFVCQRHFMYFPDPLPFQPSLWALPELKPLEVKTADGLNLKSWYVAPKKKGGGVVVFFQGNAGHLGLRNYKARSWIDKGFGVLMVGYRGFSNPGQPTEEGLYDDARSAINAAIGAGAAVEKMVFYGESLGTGIAVQMGLEFDAAGVILEAPYTRMGEVGAVHYPWIPARLLTRDKYASIDKIASIHAPILILHGEADRIVPPWMGHKLFEVANEPKQALFLPEVGHNNLYNAEVQKTVLAFLAKRSGR